MTTKKCTQCKKEFPKPYFLSKKNWVFTKYCSKECKYKNWKVGGWNKGTIGIMKVNKKSFKKGMIPWNKDLLGFNENEKNHFWKGDKVSYSGLHRWVQRHLGKPCKCEHCKNNFTGQRIHWANKDHRYKRNLSDWIRLCAKCHGKYDKYVLN